MKFSTREDIQAPQHVVFDALSEFEVYERIAMRRGVEVRRRSKPEMPGLGTVWDARFLMRQKEREITLQIATFERPDCIEINMKSKSFSGRITFELMSLSRNKTRLTVGFDIRPLTLPSRLLLQSMRLTKSSLDRRFRARVAAYVGEMQQRLSDAV